MKPFRMFTRYIRDGFKSVFRNFSLSAASISSITITLLVVAVSIIASLNVNSFSEAIIGDVTIVVFLDKDINFVEEATDNEEDVTISSATESIQNLGNVSEITFYSKLENANEMIESSDVFKNYLEPIKEEGNPLYDEFLIKVDNIDTIAETAKAIGELEMVESVNYGETIVEKVLGSFDIIRTVSYVVVLALLLVTAFLISNTIKITIFARRDEISIMRLVGASNTTIKLPFVVEGLVLGALGAAIPILVTIYAYEYFYVLYNGQLFTPLFKLIEPYPFVIYIGFGLLGIGFLIGMWGSARAVRKYLKV